MRTLIIIAVGLISFSHHALAWTSSGVGVGINSGGVGASGGCSGINCNTGTAVTQGSGINNVTAFGNSAAGSGINGSSFNGLGIPTISQTFVAPPAGQATQYFNLNQQIQQENRSGTTTSTSTRLN